MPFFTRHDDDFAYGSRALERADCVSDHGSPAITANNLSNPMRWLLPPATRIAESTLKGVRG
jgi:hypothetical protein